jgi:hypothetical protein
LAGWVRDRKQGGGKFLSLAIQPADARNGTSGIPGRVRDGRREISG